MAAQAEREREEAELAEAIAMSQAMNVLSQLSNMFIVRAPGHIDR
jgi:hypothetical protein